MARQLPVVDFPQRFSHPDEKVRQVLDRLGKTVGSVTPILDVAMLHNNGGLVVPAGATVVVEGTHTSLDFLDANIDSCRLIVRGKTAAAGPITLQLYDNTTSTILATVTVQVANLTNVGAWTPIPKAAVIAGEHELLLRVVGDAVNAQTLYSARAQFYTQRFIG